MITKTILGITVLFCLCLTTPAAASDPLEDSFDLRHRQMVEEQLKPRGIKDQRVLAAMLKVKRHLFVPPGIRYAAYDDRPLPIGEGQTISQPAVVALMTELLELKGTEKVLEIGTGSGYQAAVLGELAKQVYTIEIVEPLAKRSAKLLQELNYRNIRVKTGDGFLGWPEFAPYDAIIVTCAPDKVPPPLLEQLAEGGRLVIPVGTFWQELKLARKTRGKITESAIIPVRFVPMTRSK